MLRSLVFLILAGLVCLAAPLRAAQSDVARGNAVTARLLTAQDGVGEGMARVQAGLDLTLDPGWHSYWRSPGEVGLPPAISWEGSENVADVALAYPAPERFEAFEIQNFGYSEHVLHPLTVTLAEPGAPARLDLRLDLLVCAAICVPETLTLALDLPAGGGLDAVSADLLADWTARVPGSGAEAGIAVERAHLDDTALTVSAIATEPFANPDLFPEHGAYAAFGAPEITLSDGGRRLWARFPVAGTGEGTPMLTLVDGDRAATVSLTLSDTPPAPEGSAVGDGLWRVLLVAMLGGLILNAMPCVLPVLSIKLAAALQARDRAPARVRAGFLAAAAGVLTFFGALAVAVIGLRSAGYAVGWGVQFQNPAFLALMIGLITLFAANMLGLFEVRLGQDTLTGMARTEARGGWGGDFATGAFAAVMATPCSAPFIGTAVTYALTGGAARTLAVFLAMGTGLALPYLAVAAWPALIRRLPRPGRWMRQVQMALGGLLLLTALWLLTVLAGAAGLRMALVVGGLAAVMLAALALGTRAWQAGGVGLAALVLAGASLPPAQADRAVEAGWEPFAEARIAEEVARGNTVFVDVTADWCLTCKANKSLVLTRDTVAEALSETVALQADWTRPDDAIAAYLKANDRFGIPFDAVYGPGAPDGLLLPELLTEAAVLDAISRAGARPGAPG